MRDIAWRMGFTLMALVVLMMLAPNLSFSTTPYRLEEALGQTPQALVSEYLEAVARGDMGAALALWQEPAGSGRPVEEGGSSVTRELGHYGAGMQYRVLDVAWWRTCCEATAIGDPDTAGVATIRVAITSQGQRTRTYVFETRAGSGSWGEAAGSARRDWAIVGVHLESPRAERQAWR